jgi:hypothetical protein
MPKRSVTSSVAIRAAENCRHNLVAAAYAAIFFPFNAALSKLFLHSANLVAI